MALGGLACSRPERSERPGARARREPPPGAHWDGFPVGKVDSFITPTEEFFVRDHFGVPTVPEPWTLTVEGAVEERLVVSVDDLAKLSPVEHDVTLECAGNAGRNGLNWPGALRAWTGASTGAFEGRSLAELLRRAKPRDGAVEVAFIGADEGVERGSPESHAFARSVPIDVALAPTSMLATRMNGAELPANHGGPLRAILPGRYATDSVKWLVRMVVVTQPFEGFYQKQRYRRATREDAAGEALGELRVQSEIARPASNQRVAAGTATEVTGVAWGGSGGVERVEVSVDGGATFSDATFLDPVQPFAWRRWTWSWKPERPGPRLVVARATDHAGNSQPFLSDEELGKTYSVSGRDRIQYGNNAVPIVAINVV